MTDEYFTCPQTGRQRNLTKERAEYARKEKAARAAAHDAKQSELSRICARFEFESDEFQTAEQKAERYLKTGHVSARY